MTDETPEKESADDTEAHMRWAPDKDPEYRLKSEEAGDVEAHMPRVGSSDDPEARRRSEGSGDVEARRKSEDADDVDAHMRRSPPERRV